jgi:hypothetical protein
MKFSARAWIEIVVGLMLLVGGILAFRTWLEERDARVKAEATVDAQKKVFDQAGAHIKELQERDAERQKQTDAAIAGIKGAAAKQVTPQQIASWLPKQVQLPVPVTVTVPAPTAANPNPNAQAAIPTADLPALRDYVEKCQECEARLPGAQQDALSKAEQLRQAGIQLSAVEKERDGYRQALKGGTFWTRVKRNAKWLLVGAAAGGVAVCASGHCK